MISRRAFGKFLALLPFARKSANRQLTPAEVRKVVTGVAYVDGRLDVTTMDVAVVR